MISFRHHVASLVAVFVALAVGVVLGGGPLSELGRDGDDEPAPQQTSDDAAHAAYGDAYAEASASTLYGDRLSGQQVAVLALAGAETDVVDGVVTQVEAAGAQVAARYEGRANLTIPAEQGMVDSLATQLADDLDLGDTAPSDLSSHERIGRLLGRAIVSTEAEGEAADTTSGTILDVLETGELVTGPTERIGRVPFLVVVMGEEREEATATALLSGLVSGLGSAALGEVVVGTTASGEDGDLARLRAEDLGEVATVDGVDTLVGQVSAVLGLAAVRDGVAGAWGASGIDGPVPVVAGTPDPAADGDE